MRLLGERRPTGGGRRIRALSTAQVHRPMAGAPKRRFRTHLQGFVPGVAGYCGCTILCSMMPTPSLSKKLNPARFPGMSPFMAAIVGFVLDEHFTDPEIAELTVSENENIVYVRKTGAVGFDGLQSLEDLRNNWNRLIEVAGLTPGERAEAVRLFNQKVERVPGTEA